MRSDDYWELVEGRGTGTTRISLNAKVLSDFPLVVPMDNIVESFSSMVGAWRTRIVANVAESTALIAQRDALLPKLVTGEARM